MRYSFTITALSLLSSAFAITVTTPTSDTVWDFSTPKTIKFTSVPSDPSVISIILRSQDGSFQTKLADNVKTSDGEYTTQPNPSISNGDDYEIQIIDSAGQLAVSNTFTVEKGASVDGTTSSSSSISSTSTSSSSTFSSATSSSFSTSSSATSTATTATPATSVTSTFTSSASPTPTSSTSPFFSIAGSTTATTTSSSSTSSSTTSSSTSSDASSTSASASALPSTGAAASQFSTPKGAMALFGAAVALFYV
ncbi:hypothetical protein PEX1_107360 [Penicillium expansum]|nr:Cell wall beta-glucan synthesis [Penicillium expansum]KGO71175.1 hypothetical protein PEX1_107360 [Penicillium expansum]